MDPKRYEYPDDLLRDRIILITGASDGIGRALALEAARVGARVILHGRNTKKLEAVHDEIAALEGAVRPSIAVMDLAAADGASYTSLAESLDGEFGRLDGLVHRDRVKLPDRRAELYAEAIDVLLGKWEEAKGVQEIPILLRQQDTKRQITGRKTARPRGWRAIPS